MRRSVIIASLFATVFTGSWASGADLATIEGIVRNRAGDPLGVCVSAYDARGYNAAPAARTSSSGTYRLALLPGIYRMYFANCPDLYGGVINDYLPEWYEDAATYEEATVIRLGPGQRLSGINASLLRSSGIEGRVTNRSGRALHSIVAEAYDHAGNLSSVAVTDQNGLYRIYGLKSGTYRVLFFDLGYFADQPAYHGRVWYGGTIDAEAANIIPVGAEAIRRAIDTELPEFALPMMKGRAANVLVDAAGSRQSIGDTGEIETKWPQSRERMEHQNLPLGYVTGVRADLRFRLGRVSAVTEVAHASLPVGASAVLDLHQLKSTLEVNCVDVRSRVSLGTLSIGGRAVSTSEFIDPNTVIQTPSGLLVLNEQVPHPDGQGLILSAVHFYSGGVDVRLGYAYALVAGCPQ